MGKESEGGGGKFRRASFGHRIASGKKMGGAFT